MPPIFNFEEGEVLLLDKPQDWTSFDVVNKVRFLLKHHCGIPKIKVGHAGTLDPLATGLLILCTGKMTKRINDLLLLDKEYTGTITLGATTPSYDLETDIDKTYPIHHVTEDAIEGARLHFTGLIHQVPPAYSAKKIRGKRAYTYARQKLDVSLKPKDVTIHEFKILGIDLPDISFKVHCTKGTYIRSLAHDFGHYLKCGAHLSGLRRTRIGDYDIADAINIEQFEFLLKSENQQVD
jgi:tRNA pseudouridine55 synthase